MLATIFMSPSTYQKSYSIQLSSLSDDTFKPSPNELKSYLNKCGLIYFSLIKKYHAYITSHILKHFTPKDTSTNQPQQVPLVMTYNPALSYLPSIIHKHFNILSRCPCCTNVFKVKLFVANNLSNLLVSANIINQLPLLTHLTALSVVATTVNTQLHK